MFAYDGSAHSNANWNASCVHPPDIWLKPPFSKNIIKHFLLLDHPVQLLTDAVELLQVEGIDSEGERYEVPRVRLLVDGHVDEVVDVVPEVLEHGYHIREEVPAHGDLQEKDT